MVWPAIIAAGASLLGGKMASDGAEDANNANIAQSMEARQWQHDMRATTYQDTVQDLRRADLNPMLAYMNTNATPGAPNVAKIENTAAAGVNGALAAGQLGQMAAQTELLRAQERKTEAETAMTTSSTGKINQETKNLEAGFHNIQAELSNILNSAELKRNQSLTETERRNLMDAQRRVANIEEALKSQQISESEARTKLAAVEATLRHYETEGAKNLYNWEKTMSGGEDHGNIVKGLGAIVNTVRAIRGK